MVNWKSSIVVMFACSLCGCNPYRFTVETQHPVDCRVFTDHNDVQSHLYGFDMQPNAVVGISSRSWTQYDLSTYLTLTGGEGFQFMLRPVVEESVIDSGLVLSFSTTKGIRLDSAGHTIEESPMYHFPKDSQMYVTVYNEESYLRVTVNCDTILNRFTKRISSDHIIVKTLPGSKLHVTNPEWKKIKFINNGEVVVHQVR